MKKTILFLASLALLAPACSDDSGKNSGGDGGNSGGDASVEKLVTVDELIQGCVASTACGIQSYPTVVACVENFNNVHRVNLSAPAYSKIYRCSIAAKGDCEAVKKCWGVGATCDVNFKARCDGNTAVSCDVVGNRKTYAVDCSAAGLKCVVKSSTTATAYCSPGTCFSSSGDTCVGDQVQSCNEGIVEMQDCSVKGQVCGTASKKGGISCIGAGVTCKAEFFVPQCKETVANQCASGKEHNLDCAKQGISGTKCKEGLCVANGTACDKSFNRCSGTDLEYCHDGAWKKFECVNKGLGACKTKASGGANWGTCGDPAYP